MSIEVKIINSKHHKNKVKGICVECNKPTNRHHSADYCWECATEISNKNAEKYKNIRKSKKI